ncbi:bifunctional diguanylate cyclase/phosphodiesterase [Caballeronia sp. SBC2]|uniref:sensor domain-containing protein n=1 Tax=Caballeronia sp. SBC2 TaxID=2705547 RepID=UPI0013E20471|nr:bifunctional diguanylate cyclase/phosphodiesterase [Caballeronia sp. SBC2]QIE29523.1 EAL domain protein [Caballeronia sp. SBC2]
MKNIDYSDQQLPAESHLRFLDGGGEMGTLIRAFDWKQTPLGSPEYWPISLKTAVGIMLNAASPAYIAWGPQYVQLYNDAYRSVLGTKHPAALGLTTRETWNEIWDFVGPLFDEVILSGQAVSFENQLLPMHRHGYLEHCYFIFSYSSLSDESAARNGVFVTCWETTCHVVNQRRANHIKSISEKLSTAESSKDINDVFVQINEVCAEDIPFGIWYEFLRDKSQMRLVASAGIRSGASISPELVEIRTHEFYRPLIDPDAPVPADAPIDPGCISEETTSGIQPHTLRIEPLCYASTARPDAYLVFGMNPRRPRDDGQLQFVREVTARFENALRRVNRSELTRRETDHQLQTVLKAVPCLVWMSDPANTCFYFNDVWLEFRGHTLEEECHGGWADGVHPDDLISLINQHGDAYSARIPFAIEYRLRRADGNYRRIVDHSQPRYTASGEFLGYIGACLDITEYRVVETALRATEIRYRQIVETVQEGILIADADGCTTFANPRLEQMLGLDRGAALGRSIYDFIDAEVHAEVHIRVKDHGAAAEKREYRLKRADGSEWWAIGSISPFAALGGNVAEVLIMLTDITERKKSERQIKYLATHDLLTGLPNRAVFNDRMHEAIRHARRTGSGLAVVFIDLDRFKYVNDSFGHSIGDALLLTVAGALLQGVRAGDIVTRLGGDEFAVLLTELQHARTDGLAHAESLFARFASPFTAGQLELTISASLGIALYPDDGQTPEDLLIHADTAMYRAKEAGRSSIRFYDVEMSRQAIARAALGTALRHALDRGEFELHYQPQVRISDCVPIGIEALIRWRHPEHGMISPAHFIPIAEETGLIAAIGEWVLHAACRQNQAWHAAGLLQLPISVNLSALQLRQANFLTKVRNALEQTGLPPRYLDLEITEGMLMDKSGSVLDLLRELKMLGVSLSIDDFGTGYSNLGYLHSFPIDTLKIDQSFVRGLPENRASIAIATSITTLGQSLGLAVIAEGVETQGQADFFASLGCHSAQGYLYSRPLPANIFAAWLESREMQR